MNTEERKEFNKVYWRFLWSAILIALSGCLGNVVDAIIVGNLIGEDAVSAINLTRPVVQFMYTLNMLLATGAGILVGVEIGKKNMPRAAYFYTLSMAACLIVGLLITAVGLFCPGTATGLLCSNAHLYQLTFEYLSIMLLGAPAYMVMWALSTMVGVDGSPRLVSIAILIDNAVNLSLDIVFIQFFGWGIAGSSSATIVGHVVGIAIMFWHFRYKDNHLQLTLTSFSDQSQSVALRTLSSLTSSFKEIISQGAPLAIASVCLTLLLYNANSIVLGTLGRTGIFAFAVCMNLLQIYNLFLAGVCRTIQSLGAIQVGKGDNEAFGLVLRKSFSFITVAMILICVVVWVDPNVVSRLFGASNPDILAESNHALRIFSLSFIPFCYIYVIMIVYKLYAHHRMALFISFALSLTVIPVLWLVAHFAPNLLWYSYLIAYAIEALFIVVIHRMSHLKFELKTDK
jgi:Na+-driven multidrug efflux pump